MARFEISQMARARAFRFLAINPDLLNSLGDEGLDLVLDALGIDAQNVINKVAWSLPPSGQFTHDTERPQYPISYCNGTRAVSILDLNDNEIDSLNDTELDYYLSEFGIDPEPTIQAVASLIAESENDIAVDISKNNYGNSCSLPEVSGDDNAACLRASSSNNKENGMWGPEYCDSDNKLFTELQYSVNAYDALARRYCDTVKWQKAQLQWARHNFAYQTPTLPIDSSLENHLAFIGSIGSGKTRAVFYAQELHIASWLHNAAIFDNALDELTAYFQLQSGTIPFVIDNLMDVHLEEYHNALAPRILRHFACVAHSRNLLNKIGQYKPSDHSACAISICTVPLCSVQNLIRLDIGEWNSLRKELFMNDWRRYHAECAGMLISDLDDNLFSMTTICNGEGSVNDAIQQKLQRQLLCICYARTCREFGRVPDRAAAKPFFAEKYFDESLVGKELLPHNEIFRVKVLETPVSEQVRLLDDISGKVSGHYSPEHGARKKERLKLCPIRQ